MMIGSTKLAIPSCPSKIAIVCYTCTSKGNPKANAQRYTSKLFVAQQIYDVGGSELSDAWSITHLDIILVSCWRKYN